MPELNPFEPPSGKPAGERHLTDRELLALPRGPVRESFGDRYFWPLITLLGMSILLVPRVLELPVRFTLLGLIVLGIGLVGWVRESRKR